MQIELWRNVKIVDTSATATKRLIKMIAVGLVTAILLATTIGHTKPMDNKDTNKDSERAYFGWFRMIMEWLLTGFQ